MIVTASACGIHLDTWNLISHTNCHRIVITFRPNFCRFILMWFIVYEIGKLWFISFAPHRQILLIYMSDIEFILFPIKKKPIQSFSGGNWLPTEKKLTNCLWCGRCCRHRHCQCLCSKCWWVLVVNITRWSSGLCVNPFENRKEKRIKKPENNSSTNKIV